MRGNTCWRTGMFAALALCAVARAQQDAPQELLFVPKEGLAAHDIARLRTLKRAPFTRNVPILAKTIADLEAARKLSAGTKARLEVLVGVAADTSPAGLELALRTLNTRVLPRASFLQVADALEPDELASVLERTGSFELLRMPNASDLPQGVEVKDLAELVRQLQLLKGQVIEGSKVTALIPGKPDLRELASKPGLGGVIDSPERIQGCSEIAARYNEAFELATNRDDVAAQINREALGSQVEKICFRAVSDPAPIELSVFGMLEYPGGDLRCAALLERRGTIVTARHCLFDEENGAEAWSGVFFRPWLHPEKRIALTGVRAPKNDQPDPIVDFATENDVAEATLAEAIDGGARVCWETVSEAAQPLGLFGYLPEAPAPMNASWPARLRMSTGGTCVAQKNQGTCFVHFCNAVPRFSGSPVFAVADGSCPHGVRVVGLHVAKSGRNSKGCDRTRNGNDAIAGLRVTQLLPALPGN